VSPFIAGIVQNPRKGGAYTLNLADESL
jgi:hypothetical protein